MSAITFFFILAFICHLISPDLGEMATNISLVVLLVLTIVGLIGFTTAQENAAEIQPSAANSIAIHTVQIIENDGSISFEYRGNADVEIWSDRITLHDGDETWTVFKNQDGALVFESPKQK